jgi:rsbT co-antagonist protein RsbR
MTTAPSAPSASPAGGDYGAALHDVHRFFFSHALDMLCIAGFDGYFKELNPTWERVLGYTNQELTAKPFLAFVHPDDHEATIAEAQKLAEEGIDTISFENRYCCKDGSYRRLRWSVTPDKATGLLFALARDVTQEYETVMALQASEVRFRELTQNIPGAVFQFSERDGVWKIDYMSERVTEIAGLSVAEITQDFSAFIARIHPEDRDAYIASVARVLKDLSQWRFEGRFLMPDGSICWWEGTSQPVRNASGEIVFNGVMFDTTARKTAEEALRQAMLQEEIIRAQQAALEELSTPLIPLSDRVTVMPLIGTMDTRRAQQVMDSLLHGISTSGADTAILDITGVSVVDTQVANALVRASQAVKLLGARVILTGIRPEVAQTLVSLGVDLSGITTCGTLQSGIALALQRR